MIRSALLLSLAVLCATPNASAQELEPAAAEMAVDPPVEPGVSVLPLTVNAVPAGEAVVLIWPDDVWVEREPLVRARVVIPDGAVLNHAERPFVALGRMKDLLTHELSAELELHLTVAARAFAEQRIVMSTPRPRIDAAGSPSSLYINYGLDWNSGNRLPGVQAEAGLRAGAALVTATAARTPAGDFVWHGAQASVDDERRLVRWTVGEQFGLGGSHRGSEPFTGVTLSRAFDLNPYLPGHPMPRLEGVATTPSTVEIYANGGLVRREQVQPGVFHLAGIPAAAGAGQLDIVIRDAFGRAQSFSSSYYEASSLLARGQHEFSYSAGMTGSAAQRVEKRSMLVSAFHRYGATQWATIGGRFDRSAHGADVGTSLGMRLPVAELSVDGTLRTRDAVQRAALSVSINRSHRVTSMGATVRMLQQGFEARDSRSPDPLRMLMAHVSWNASSLVSLAARYSHQQWLSGPGCHETALTATGRTGRRGNFQVTVAHACRQNNARAVQATIGYTLMLGQRASAHVHHSGNNATTIDVQRPLGSGAGSGYRVHASSRGDTIVEAQAARGAGRYEMSYAQHGGTGRLAARASGSVVFAGGAVLFSRPVQDAFAVVRVPGVRGVRVYASGQEVGRTDARGNLLVPGLLPSYGNELSIADQDVPLTHSIGTVKRVAAPRRRGAAVVLFDTQRRRAVSGTVRVAGSDTIPAFGQISLTDDSGLSSPITSEGLFYFDTIPVGRHTAEVRHDGGTCVVSFEVRETAAGEHADLGTMTCSPTVQ